MPISMYDASVPVFTQFLHNLKSLIAMARAHADARNFDSAILMRARLYPNMYDLTRQVGEAIRHAVIACALLSQLDDPPSLSTEEAGAAEIEDRLAQAIHFLERLDPSQINGTENDKVVFKFRNGSERQFSGQALLLTFSLPQFFFHVTTAYDILRHCGVDLAKRDFLGTRI